MDFVQAGTMTHNLQPKTVEYKIENVDYWEQDATLVVGDLRIYFQFDYKGRSAGDDFPTVMDALEYLSNEVDSKWGIKR